MKGYCNMKKIAILTKYYKNYNYGGMLQGYALCKVIRNMGYECDIISYDVNSNINPVYPNLISQSKQYGIGETISKVFEKITGKLRFLIKDILADRRKLFDSFEQKCNADTKLYDDSNISELNDNYDVFVSGSDQIWNPNAVRKLYLQTFVDNKKTKIAYGASIGRGELSSVESEVMIPFIKRFDYIGVREKTAKSIISSYLLDKDIHVVLDPTFLLSIEQWNDICSQRPVSEKYALIYFFSNSLNVRKSIEGFCRDNGLRMVMIPFAKQEFNFTDKKGNCLRLEKTGPEEFLSAIKNAEYVFTDSFHGAVFSIINSKQFFVYERNKAGKVSMNSRLYDLLDLFGLSDRMISLDEEDQIQKMEQINYEMVNKILNMQRQMSMSFLQNAIEDRKNDQS